MSKVLVNAKPTPANLPEFVPFACGQLRASFTVLVQTKVQDEYVSKVEDKTKKGKKSLAVLQQKSASDEEPTDGGAIAGLIDFDSGEIRIAATLDTANQLVGVTINRCAATPRLLLQVIGLCVPYCPHLSTLTLQYCNLTGPLLYEIAKFLPESQITEISLDASPIAGNERSYYMLLERPSNLRSLSLARCSLSDIDCELLFAQLEHPLPASKTLMTLNLTSNFISDTAAYTIGNCLRSNRSLQYLNLSGNQITDDGAAHIIKSLVEFPLTANEIVKKKQRFIDYLILRKNMYDKFYKEITNMIATKTFDEMSTKSSKRKASRARPPSYQQITKSSGDSKEITAAKAEMMTDEFVGNYSDPFSTEETVYRDKYIYCTGNMSLCCLNLAYNNLGFISIKNLIQVLKHQNSLTKSSGAGLLYVQIEGNYLPMCKETDMLQDLLEQAVLSRTTRLQAPRKDRAKIKK